MSPRQPWPPRGRQGQLEEVVVLGARAQGYLEHQGYVGRPPDGGDPGHHPGAPAGGGQQEHDYDWGVGRSVLPPLPGL